MILVRCYTGRGGRRPAAGAAAAAARRQRGGRPAAGLLAGVRGDDGLPERCCMRRESLTLSGAREPCGVGEAWLALNNEPTGGMPAEGDCLTIRIVSTKPGILCK